MIKFHGMGKVRLVKSLLPKNVSFHHAGYPSSLARDISMFMARKYVVDAANSLLSVRFTR
jgi:hypothetical protein